MMNRHQARPLEDFREPAALRLALSSVILKLLNTGRMSSTDEASSVLDCLPSVPAQHHIAEDVNTLDNLHLTVQGVLTRTGRAVAELNHTVEHSVILLSAAMLGVGGKVSKVLAATDSQKMFESLCENKHCFKSRCAQWLGGCEACDVRFLARAVEDYESGHTNSISDVIGSGVFEDVMKEVGVYRGDIAWCLQHDDSPPRNSSTMSGLSFTGRS